LQGDSQVDPTSYWADTSPVLKASSRDPVACCPQARKTLKELEDIIYNPSRVALIVLSYPFRRPQHRTPRCLTRSFPALQSRDGQHRPHTRGGGYSKDGHTRGMVDQGIPPSAVGIDSPDSDDETPTEVVGAPSKWGVRQRPRVATGDRLNYDPDKVLSSAPLVATQKTAVAGGLNRLPLARAQEKARRAERRAERRKDYSVPRTIHDQARAVPADAERRSAAASACFRTCTQRRPLRPARSIRTGRTRAERHRRCCTRCRCTSRLTRGAPPPPPHSTAKAFRVKWVRAPVARLFPCAAARSTVCVCCRTCLVCDYFCGGTSRRPRQLSCVPSCVPSCA